jgi:hypothetical protein
VIRRAIFNKGRYWMGKSLMHGIYLLNGMGMVPNRLTTDSSILKPYYFVEGIFMDGITGYNKALKIHEDFIISITNNIAVLADDEQRFTAEVVKYARFPTVSLTQTLDEQDCFDCMGAGEANSFYAGTFHPLFSNREYTFIKGDLESIRISKDNLRIADHDEKDAEMSRLYLDVCRTDYSKDDTFKIGLKLMYIAGFCNPFSPFQNVVFAFTDLNDEIELQLMLIHYLKDFSSDLKTACNLCPSKGINLVGPCIHCKNCGDELKKLATEVNYEILN